MLTDLFTGAKEKIARAYALFEDVRCESEAHFNQVDAFEVVVEPDPATGDRLAKVRLNKPIPNRWVVDVGMAAVQLRSSLDLMTTAMVRAHGSTGARASIRFQRNEQRFREKNRELLELLAPNAAEWLVQDVQPYRTGNAALCGLNDLANEDKHGDLLPVGSIGNARFFQGISIVNAKKGMVLSGPGRVDEGLVISNLGTIGTISLSSKSRINVETQLAFGEGQAFAGEWVLPTLDALGRMIVRIIKTAEGYCGPLRSWPEFGRRC